MLKPGVIYEDSEGTWLITDIDKNTNIASITCIDSKDKKNIGTEYDVFVEEIEILIKKETTR